jgi:hypothetical protein
MSEQLTIKIEKGKVFNCLHCKNDFKSIKSCKNRTPKYCSKKCYSENLKKYKICNCCKISFANWANDKYCSLKCKNDSRKGITFSEVWKNNISEARKNSIKCKGENLYNWKGGLLTLKLRAKGYFYKRKRSLKLDFNQDYLNRLLIVQQNKCFFCESNLSNYKAIEHLTPVSKGGDNENYNLVYSCKSCNSKKRQLTLEQFALKTGKIYLLDKFDYVYSSAIN